LWHVPDVVTNAIAMNCALTSGASVAHPTRAGNPAGDSRGLDSVVVTLYCPLQ
jgi:hypothetical protein